MTKNKTKKNQKQNQKQNQKKKKQNQKQHEIINDMIATVDNDSVSTGPAALIEVPTDEVLDQQNFPQPVISTHSIEFLRNNVCLDYDDEWRDAWMSICDDIDVKVEPINFWEYSRKKQEEFRKRMIEMIRRPKRVLMYRKWMYAKAREDDIVVDEVEETVIHAADDDVQVDADAEVHDVEVGQGGDVDDVRVGGALDVVEVGQRGNFDVVRVSGALDVVVGVSNDDHDVALDDEVVEGGDVNDDRADGALDVRVGVVHDIGVGVVADIGVGDNIADIHDNLVVGVAQVGIGVVPVPNVVDLYPAFGCQPNETNDFPIHSDGDQILYYAQPFSLGSWFKNHFAADSRWLTVYKNWGGSKMNRETLAIVQSLVSWFVDHMETDGPHGRLEDMYNYKVTQVIENHVGSRKVRFVIELLNRGETVSREQSSLDNDRQQFISVLQTVVSGDVLDDEIKCLFDLLSGDSVKVAWQKSLLRNYPGLWDGYERSSFFINLYSRHLNDHHMRAAIDGVYGIATTPLLLMSRSVSEFGWVAKIPQNSVFDDVLRYRGTAAVPVRYTEGSIVEIVKYIRICLQHFRQHVRGLSKDVREIEMMLSRIFPNVLLCIYAGMCSSRWFLS